MDTRSPGIDPTEMSPGLSYRYHFQATFWLNNFVAGQTSGAGCCLKTPFVVATGPASIRRIRNYGQIGGVVTTGVEFVYESGNLSLTTVIGVESDSPASNPGDTAKPGSYRVALVERLDTGERIENNNPPLPALPYTYSPPGKIAPPPLPPAPPGTDKNDDKKDAPGDRKVPGPIFFDFPGKPNNDKDSDQNQDNDPDQNKNPNPDPLQPVPEPTDKTDPKNHLGLKPTPLAPTTRTYVKNPDGSTVTGPTLPDVLIPLFPPFPIINPQNPTVPEKEEKKSPVYQTPPGNGCCVPTSTSQKLDAIDKKVDSLNPTQLIDWTLLKTIDNKLGPQINGGLSGFMKDRFLKLWNSRVIDRALNLMAVGASLHNAIMLSRDLGATLIETTGNVLSAVGIKDADGEAFDFNTIIGETVENFVKSAVGEENYTKLKQTWVKANRILTAGANLIDSVRSMQNTIIEAQEVVGGWVAKIGNGLSQDGIVNDDTIDWMPEKPNFKNPFLRAQETIENLTEAAESVNQLAAAVIETQELTKQINDNYKTFTDEMNIKSDEKKTKEKDKKEESESSEINKSDLKEGAPNDAD
ncbi:MAG: hypothetical protein EWV41_19775 [Microcystis wesenbergii Mw_MB_S_20031200_S109]|uniref:Uncharacterized protein n=1 Tax=Microcystis wesenbergii Mw_MB_S_20031200_S109D TaxID=2486241 RepID=A0A552M9R2_9CHRO|nr:MAG: hypothetical protein EWV41_19775 [Microcystis wesenbergii Mw_MB_S_20031200_S109]TRV29205.1 MAG: hypothetical protein EWV88_01695 [Microcystis wesenbergii Mw_MB_S_20031200_S109D]